MRNNRASYGKLIGWALAALALGAAVPAQADVTCAFSIQFLALDTQGNINGSFVNSGNYYLWTICGTQNPVTVNNGYATNMAVGTGACNALFAQLLTARASGQPVSMVFHGPSACTSAGGLPANGWMSGSGTTGLYPSDFMF